VGRVQLGDPRNDAEYNSALPGPDHTVPTRVTCPPIPGWSFISFMSSWWNENGPPFVSMTSRSIHSSDSALISSSDNALA
jgi:hypothetical protein